MPTIRTIHLFLDLGIGFLWHRDGLCFAEAFPLHAGFCLFDVPENSSSKSTVLLREGHELPLKYHQCLTLHLDLNGKLTAI